jgi:hypothetical protein
MAAGEIPMESRALFACASVRTPNERLDTLRDALDQGLNLDRLVRMARDNDMAPLLHRDAVALSDDSPSAQELAERLRGNRDFNTRRSTVLLIELARLLRLFDACGVPVIPYKGPSFALRHYDAPALRPCGDLDLLVAKSDVMRGLEMLQANGYRIRRRESPLSLKDLVEYDNEITLDHRENPLLTTELHWNLLTPGLRHPLSSEVILRESRPEVLRGVPTRALHPEVEFAIMALHAGLKHQWMPLKVLADITRLIQRNPNLDWIAVRGFLKDTYSWRWTQLGIDAAAHFLGAEVPEKLLQECRTRGQHRAMLAVLVGRYGLPNLSWPSFREWQAGYRELNPAERKSPRSVAELALYVRASLTPQYSDHLAQVGKKGILTRSRYFRRPWRQFRKYGFSVLRRAAGSGEARP